MPPLAAELLAQAWALLCLARVDLDAAPLLGDLALALAALRGLREPPPARFAIKAPWKRASASCTRTSAGASSPATSPR